MPLNSTECTFNVFFVNEDGDECLAFSHDLIIISARVTALDKHEYCPNSYPLSPIRTQTYHV